MNTLDLVDTRSPRSVSDVSLSSYDTQGTLRSIKVARIYRKFPEMSSMKILSAFLFTFVMTVSLMLIVLWYTGCSQENYRCSDGTCISKEKFCDGTTYDCSTGEDENETYCLIPKRESTNRIDIAIKWEDIDCCELQYVPYFTPSNQSCSEGDIVIGGSANPPQKSGARKKRSPSNPLKRRVSLILRHKRMIEVPFGSDSILRRVPINVGKKFQKFLNHGLAKLIKRFHISRCGRANINDFYCFINGSDVFFCNEFDYYRNGSRVYWDHRYKQYLLKYCKDLLKSFSKIFRRKMELAEFQSTFTVSIILLDIKNFGQLKPNNFSKYLHQHVPIKTKSQSLNFQKEFRKLITELISYLNSKKTSYNNKICIFKNFKNYDRLNENFTKFNTEKCIAEYCEKLMKAKDTELIYVLPTILKDPSKMKISNNSSTLDLKFISYLKQLKKYPIFSIIFLTKHNHALIASTSSSPYFSVDSFQLQNTRDKQKSNKINIPYFVTSSITNSKPMQFIKNNGQMKRVENNHISSEQTTSNTLTKHGTDMEDTIMKAEKTESVVDHKQERQVETLYQERGKIKKSNKLVNDYKEGGVHTDRLNQSYKSSELLNSNSHTMRQNNDEQFTLTTYDKNHRYNQIKQAGKLGQNEVHSEGKNINEYAEYGGHKNRVKRSHKSTDLTTSYAETKQQNMTEQSTVEADNIERGGQEDESSGGEVETEEVGESGDEAEREGTSEVGIVGENEVENDQQREADKESNQQDEEDAEEDKKPQKEDEKEDKNEKHKNQKNSDKIQESSEVCFCEQRSVVKCKNLKSIPRNISDGVTKLILADNQITEIYSDDLANYRNLRHGLYLQNNLINQIHQRPFKNQKNLKRLYMNGNYLKILESSHCDGLQELEIFHLFDNKIHSLNFSCFSHTPNLNMLLLSRNKLELRHGQFPLMTKLTILHLQNNKITMISEELFANLPSLVTLSLQKNRIEYIHPRALNSLTSLKALDLSNNLIKSISGIFTTLRNLESLNLRGLYLNSSLKSDYENLTSLKRVYFPKSRFCLLVEKAETCQPISDGITTRENLMQSTLLRISVWMVALLTVIGNVAVILCREISRQDDRILVLFIKNLAMADLMMGIYLTIVGVQDLLTRGHFARDASKWTTSIWCTIAGSLALISTEASVLILAYMSLQRYLSITTVRNNHKLTTKFTKSSLLVLWLTSMVIASFPVFGISNFYGMNSMCFPLHINEPFIEGWQYSAFVFLGLNTISLLVMTSSYLCLFFNIRDTRSRTPLTKTELSFIVRVLLIVFTDCACWVPILAVKSVALAEIPIPGEVYAWLVTLILPINSAINPILYTFSTTQFVSRIKKFLYRKVLPEKRRKRREKRPKRTSDNYLQTMKCENSHASKCFLYTPNTCASTQVSDFISPNNKDKETPRLDSSEKCRKK